MKKTIYELPSVRILKVRVEGIINASGNSTMQALGNSSVDDMTDYGDGSPISW